MDSRKKAQRNGHHEGSQEQQKKPLSRVAEVPRRRGAEEGKGETETICRAIQILVLQTPLSIQPATLSVKGKRIEKEKIRG